MLRLIGMFSLVVLSLIGCYNAQDLQVSFLEHELILSIEPEHNRVNVSDHGQLVMQRGWNSFKVNSNGAFHKFKVRTILDSTETEAEKIDREIELRLDEVEGEDYLLASFFSGKAATVDFSYFTEIVFDEDVEEISFSNQNVGREVTGTIGEQGAYLSPPAYYYPRGDDELMNFYVYTTMPEGWRSVSDGNRVYLNSKDDKSFEAWDNPYLVDGVTVMAAPFVVRSTMVDSIEVSCYFFAEDTSLFKTYLPATARYVSMYSDMIGAYPYKNFKVVENFFPTGYGFPGWTLLGQEVIRLPFIVMTSLGHEVLHNWWGNSVYVDYERGNWCEGLTVYGADYMYKEMRSAAAARDYRKDILKQYKSYVNAENEFPVREFVSRSSSHERTLGYNKVMMIFHMIRSEIGDQAFWDSWEDVYAQHLEEEISWEEWMDAYEQSSGEDLSHIIPQWVDRKGAAMLNLEVLHSNYDAGRGETSLKLQITQPDDEFYQLKVPYRLRGDETYRGSLLVDGAVSSHELSIPGRFTSLELDPDYDVFRHLYPEEIEPILATIYGSPEKHFIIYEENETHDTLFKEFGANLTEDEVVLEMSNVLVGRDGEFAAILLNPAKLPPSLEGLVRREGDTVWVNGTAYGAENSFFFAVREDELNAHMLVVLNRNASDLPRLGQKLPHYGKYSFLVFEGTTNVGKGQWPAKDSPLKRTL